MKNIKNLLIYEFQNQFFSYKFVILLILSISLTSAYTVVKLNTFKEEINKYNSETNQNLKDAKNFRVFSDVLLPIQNKPNPLTFYVNGIIKEGSRINITWDEMPEYAPFEQISNPYIKTIQEFDITKLIQLIISIFSIFLVATTISSEREEHTLKLIFSNNVLRTEYFLSKFIASLILLVIVLVIVYGIVSLVIVLNGLQVFTDYFVLKSILLFLSSIFYISILISISLVISTKSHQSRNALLAGLLIWIFLVLILPNMVKTCINNLYKVPTEEMVKNKINDFNDDLFEKINEFNNKNFPTDGNIGLNMSEGRIPGIFEVVGLADKNMIYFGEKQIKTLLPEIFKKQSMVISEYQDYRNKLASQQRLISNILFFSPDEIFISASCKIAGNHFSSDIKFWEQVYNFRNNYISYLNSKNAIGISFFTQLKEKDIKDRLLDYSIDLQKKYNDPFLYPKLELNDLPTWANIETFSFPYRELTLLILMNLILLAFGIYFFQKTDII